MRHFDLLSFWIGGMIACYGFVFIQFRDVSFETRYRLARAPIIAAMVLVCFILFWPALLAFLASRREDETDDDFEDEDSDDAQEDESEAEDESP